MNFFVLHVDLHLSTQRKYCMVKKLLPGNMLMQTVNCRYSLLVYNGSVHYWRISRVLQREGLRCHLLPSGQTVVDAVRKLPDKQEWLSSLLLQLALGQLEVTGKLFMQPFTIKHSTNHKSSTYLGKPSAICGTGKP